MSNEKDRIRFLLQRYADNQAGVGEITELLDLLKQGGGDTVLESFILDLCANSSQSKSARVDWEKVWAGIHESIHRPAKVRKIPRWRWAAAAAVLILLGAGYWFYDNRNEGKNEITQAPPVEKDLPPGHDGALLTLGNGKKILLDTARNGILAMQGAMKLQNSKGQLSYQPELKGENSELIYNVLTTPRGRQYQLVLEDGSKVWLNAGSSIKYPARFSGPERSVEISGEAYFEVAKNPAKPFRVKVNGLEVLVLGTHFNINSYGDEASVKTTLLEGSVGINKPNTNRVILKPGQQAAVSNNLDNIKVINDADLEGVMAWKNGLFRISSADIPSIMRQLSRWYDIDVVYEGAVPPGHITATVPRNMSLSKVLDAFQLSGVNFTIEGKRIIVRPR